MKYPYRLEQCMLFLSFPIKDIVFSLNLEKSIKPQTLIVITHKESFPQSPLSPTKAKVNTNSNTHTHFQNSYCLVGVYYSKYYLFQYPKENLIINSHIGYYIPND